MEQIAETSYYSIKLPAFEGPLDLLLHLIRENRIDIYNIPIALITHQYLEYLEIMKELNLDIAGEFLVMAATLIHIKSRMLLPVDEDTPEEEREDPRFELVQRLIEYQAFKEVSLALREREIEWSNVFIRVHAQEESDAETSAELDLFDLSIFDLISAFKRILEKTPPDVVTITRETLTIKDRVAYILERIEDTEAIRFEDLFDENRTRPRLIITFLALLEILRLGLVRVYQERDFGSIWIINPQRVTGNSQ